VYKSSLNNQQAATKIFSADCINSFEQELGIMTGLDHPNIIKLYRSFTEFSVFIIVMELAETSLSEGRAIKTLLSV
jgi:serine/threonine protein kinase